MTLCGFSGDGGGRARGDDELMKKGILKLVPKVLKGIYSWECVGGASRRPFEYQGCDFINKYIYCHVNINKIRKRITVLLTSSFYWI